MLADDKAFLWRYAPVPVFNGNFIAGEFYMSCDAVRLFAGEEDPQPAAVSAAEAGIGRLLRRVKGLDAGWKIRRPVVKWLFHFSNNTPQLISPLS